MIVTKKIQKIGNSLGIILDKSILDEVKLQKGDLIECLFRVPANIETEKGFIKRR